MCSFKTVIHSCICQSSISEWIFDIYFCSFEYEILDDWELIGTCSNVQCVEIVLSIDDLIEIVFQAFFPELPNNFLNLFEIGITQGFLHSVPISVGIKCIECRMPSDVIMKFKQRQVKPPIGWPFEQSEPIKPFPGNLLSVWGVLNF